MSQDGDPLFKKTPVNASKLRKYHFPYQDYLEVIARN